MRIIRWFFIWIGMVSTMLATTYYVRTDGNNSHTGTTNSAGGAWLTIAKAASTMAAGDTVRVQPGDYNENVSVTVSGTAGNFITYLADGAVSSRGFSLPNTSYIRISGFEIYHTSTTYANGIGFGNGSSGNCTHIEILGCYIHNTSKTLIQQNHNSTSSYVVVRGCRLEYAGYPSGGSLVDGYNAITTTVIKPDGSQGLCSDHWLVEYNTSTQVIDFSDLYGADNYVRNNYYHDPYPEPPSVYHADFAQPGSDGINAGTAHQLYEANIVVNNLGADGHAFLLQDNDGSGTYHGDTDIVVRGNAASHIGSFPFTVLSIPHVSLYGNTFYKLLQTSASGNVLNWSKSSSSTQLPDHPTCANNLLSDWGNGTGSINIQSGTTIDSGQVVTNWGYLAGTAASYLGTTDPVFSDTSINDFRLTSGSPAGVKSGGSSLVTITSASSTGTSFTVDQPLVLRDGDSISGLRGDTVTIGATTTYITAISGSTVTVNDAVTWTQNVTPVYWGFSSTVQLGALPYGAPATCDITTTTDTAAPTTLSATTTNVQAVRFVEWYWNHLLVATTQYTGSSPLTASYTPSGLGVLETRAYNYWLSQTPTVSAYQLINQDPSALGATPVSPAQINLAWTDNSAGVDTFSIERSPNGSTGWAEIGTTAATVVTYQSTGLAAATIYYYRVRAVSGGVYSGYSSTANATTLGSTPFAPTLRNPASLGAGL